MKERSEVVAHGRHLPLQATSLGPELAPAEPRDDAFVAIVNAGLRHDSDGLLDALLAGAEYGGDGMSVSRVEDGGGLALRFQVGVLADVSVVPAEVATAVVRQLQDLRDEEGPAAPWLFRRDPIANSAHPDELAVVRLLDARVAAVDQTGVPGALDAPGVLEERRAILVAMDSAGLMTAERQGAKLQRLLRWRLDSLAAWYEAALATTQYLASEGRRRYVPDAVVEPVLGGPVCIDAFRGGLQILPSVDLHEWASWGEWLVANAPRDGNQGEFGHHDEDGWLTVRWRRDHPSRASLLALTLGRPTIPADVAVTAR